MVVVAIISLISALAFPNISSWIKERETRNAAQRIKTLMTNINSQVQRGKYGFVQVFVQDLADDEKQIVEHDLNLEDVQINKPEGHKNEIEFEKGYGVVLRYPTIKSFKGLNSNTELSFKILKESIASIYKGDDVYDRNNITDKELDEYIDSLTQRQYKQLMVFFDTMPRLRHTVKYQNPKSGKEFTMTLNGTNDFF